MRERMYLVLALCGELVIDGVVGNDLEQSRFKDLSSSEFVFPFLSFRRLRHHTESVKL